MDTLQWASVKRQEEGGDEPRNARNTRKDRNPPGNPPLTGKQRKALGKRPKCLSFCHFEAVFRGQNARCLYRRRFLKNPAHLEISRFPIYPLRFPKSRDFIHRPISCNLEHSHLCLFCAHSGYCNPFHFACALIAKSSPRRVQIHPRA